MRADVNLSVREVGQKEFGTRTEMKNLNSFKAIAHAIEGERERQIELLEEGRAVVQETRRWDDNKESSHAMRSKEDAKDYRYFPDPDLPPIHISDAWIEELRTSIPELREAKMERYQKEYELPAYDAGILTESRHLAGLFEETAVLLGNPKKVANWFMVEVLRLMKEKGILSRFGIVLLILLALGASDETICQDFVRTNVCRRPELEKIWAAHAEEIEAHPEQKQFYQGIAGVHPESAPFVLDTIRKEYGTTDAYLEAEYGLTPARLMRLRRMYLE